MKLFSDECSKAFRVLKSTQVHTSHEKSTRFHTSFSDSTRVRSNLKESDASLILCIPIYSSLSESIELFVIYWNIWFAKNHHQSLQIIKNYRILSDSFESELSFDFIENKFLLWKVLVVFSLNLI